MINCYSKKHGAVNVDDLDTSSECDNENQASVSHRYRVVLQQLDDGPKFTHEWFLLKEEEMELRSHLNRDASSCNARVTAGNRLVDEQTVFSNDFDDNCAGDVGGANASTGNIFRAIRDSSIDNDKVEEPSKAEPATPHPTDDSCISVFSGKPKYIQNTETATLMETLDCADNNIPPIPLTVHHCKSKDGSTAKQNGAETFIDMEGAPVPGVLSIDVPETKKLSPAKGEIWPKDKQSTSRGRDVGPAALPRQTPLPAALPDCMNQDKALPNQEIVQKSSVIHPAVNISDGLQSLPHVTQVGSNLPSSVSDTLSQSSPNENVYREEEKEDIMFIPEAFIVEESAPEEVQIAEIAELVEPDPSRLSLKKRHACLFLVIMALIVIALGISLSGKFSRSNENSIPESTVPNQPEKEPSVPSSQPSVVQQSSHPTLSIRDDIERNVLERNATFDGNRGLALDWILKTDELQLDVSDSNLHQRYILTLLSFEFGISEWRLPGSMSECEWYGVGCSINGTVLKLELGLFMCSGMCDLDLILDGHELTGTMPPEIAGLQYLKQLSLGSNSFYGTLPSELGKLTSLTHLYLGYNNFDGTLPSELGNLKELTLFSLEFNELTGTIPSELRNLNALTRFSIAQNNLNGTFPSWLVKSFTLIDHLHIDTNQFSGTLPSEIGMLTTLKHCDVHSNGFSGTLPTEIGKLTLSTFLNVGHNSLWGTLPSELGNIKELTLLSLEFNELTGTIPSELRNLNALTTFSVAQNNLNGTFPSWLVESFTLIDHLHIDTNQFSGTLPSEIGMLTALEHFDVHSNGFSGTLPTEIGKLTLLTFLNFGYNSLRGKLPPEIGMLASLTGLYASNNQLTGMIPSEIGNLVQLSVLWLHDNHLSGPLPSEIGNLFQLTDLMLFDNHLSGPLPSEIGRLTSLTFLSVGPNNLNGTVPAEVGNLSELWHLSVGVNNFTGTIPSEIGQLSKLTELLLQENGFTGYLPPGLKNCSTGMTRFCFNDNQLTGVLPTECGCDV
ncbi:hypothetical protein HJC23_007352 [Cyclotella cryptica]|uniref:Leucine-rich repeat-containing N-terminal plant-type domain-containing protein n=1 Tax=Cyclotella cryptica TaxID=29204 RepID=A0ABD3Q550_9STRA